MNDSYFFDWINSDFYNIAAFFGSSAGIIISKISSDFFFFGISIVPFISSSFYSTGINFSILPPFDCLLSVSLGLLEFLLETENDFCWGDGENGSDSFLLTLLFMRDVKISLWDFYSLESACFTFYFESLFSDFLSASDAGGLLASYMSNFSFFSYNFKTFSLISLYF